MHINAKNVENLYAWNEGSDKIWSDEQNLEAHWNG